MPDIALLGLVLSLVTVNMTMLGIVLKTLVTNGKPKKLQGNPHPMDPDDIMLGTMSLAAFKKECVAPIVRAIEGQRGS